MRAALLALVLVLIGAAPASAQENPIFQSPGIPPAGANDPACKPAAAHPYPVILVHGTFGDMTVSWNSIAPALESKGFCVWALDYGRRGTGPIDASADQLVAFIDMVRAKTGAARSRCSATRKAGCSRVRRAPPRAARRRRRHHRLRPVEPRHDEPARRPGRHVRLHRLRRAAGRLGVHAQGQRAAARGARPRVVHGADDHARRGRHALYGRRSFRISAGRTRTLRVRLKGHPARVRARALLPQPGGGVAVTSRKYRLR